MIRMLNYSQESEVDICQDLKASFINLHGILTALRNYDMVPALE